MLNSLIPILLIAFAIILLIVPQIGLRKASNEARQKAQEAQSRLQELLSRAKQSLDTVDESQKRRQQIETDFLAHQKETNQLLQQILDAIKKNT